MSLSIDMAPLWDSVNNNFPVFLGILAIPAGIGIAIALANFIISKVQEAFR